jgi:hypothetical protein
VNNHRVIAYADSIDRFLLREIALDADGQPTLPAVSLVGSHHCKNEPRFTAVPVELRPFGTGCLLFEALTLQPGEKEKMTLKEKREHVKSVLMPAARKAVLSVVTTEGYKVCVKDLVSADGTLNFGFERSLRRFVAHWAKQAYQMRPFPSRALERRTTREGYNLGHFIVHKIDTLCEREWRKQRIGAPKTKAA